MNDKAFVDTNILIYAHHTASGAKHTAARELVESLWEDGTGVISTQVLQELSVNLRRKAGTPIGLGEMRAVIAEYSAWQVIINTPQSVLQALAIEERFHISFWDALIVQAAEIAGRRCCTPKIYPTAKLMEVCWP